MSDKSLYFAYGSNINLEQMADRCPDAKPVGPVTLDNYELLFRGGGFATIAPCEGSQVQGLLWEITPRSERALDFYEGYPSFYEKQSVSVRDSQGTEHSVMVYVMTGERSRIPVRPSPFYYAGIVEGLRQNGMPVEPLEQAFRNLMDEVRAMDMGSQSAVDVPTVHRPPKQRGGRDDGR